MTDVSQMLLVSSGANVNNTMQVIARGGELEK